MAKLIESIIHQFPIGTLMFLKYDENSNLGKRSFTGNSGNFEPDYYVIDGQQKIVNIV